MNKLSQMRRFLLGCAAGLILLQPGGAAGGCTFDPNFSQSILQLGALNAADLVITDITSYLWVETLHAIGFG